MGIAAVDMSEKNNKSNSPADNTKSEKKMTKYDLKMQRRQEEEKKAKKGEGNHQNRLYSRSDHLCMYCCLEVL